MSRDYFEEIHDQFDIETIGSFTGSYVDDVMSGSVAPAFAQDIFRTHATIVSRDALQGSDLSSAIYPDNEGTPLTRFVGSRQTAGTVGDQGTLRRNIRHMFLDEYEEHSVPHQYAAMARTAEGAITQLRVHVPSVVDYVANVIGGYQAVADDFAAAFGLPLGSYFGFQSWPFAFPFEKKFRKVQKSFSALNRRKVNNVVLLPDVGKTAEAGTAPRQGWAEHLQVASNEQTRLAISGSNFTDFRDLSGDGNYNDDDISLGATGFEPGFLLITGSFNITSFDDQSIPLNNPNKFGDKSTRNAMKILYGIGSSNRGRHTALRLFKRNHDSTGNDEDGSNAHSFIDHPRGTKYGYSNIFTTPPTCVFRRDRFGQFRDMLEQSHNTFTVDVGFNVIRRQVVTVKFVELENPRSPTDPYNTHRGNKDRHSRSFVPFLDQDPLTGNALKEALSGQTPDPDTALSPSENLVDYMNLNQRNKKVFSLRGNK